MLLDCSHLSSDLPSINRGQGERSPMATGLAQSLPSISTEPARRSLRAAKYPQAKISLPPDVDAAVAAWVASFNQVLRCKDFASFKNLFFDESYWRDQLGLSWDFHTFKGPAEIQSFLERHPKGSRLKCLRIDKRDTSHGPKLSVIDHKSHIIGLQAILEVETDVGIGNGVVKLLYDAKDHTWKAFTLYTVMQELTGHEETIKHRRNRDVCHGDKGKFQNWLERRTAQENFQGCLEPAVLVIGAGQAGLSTCARLQQLRISNLIIDRSKRIGDSWRNRYHRMVLHDPVWYNHLPYLPFPENWPVFAPKDKIAEWMEFYARATELNVWTSTVLKTAVWGGANWEVTVVRDFPDGRREERTLHPRHIIQATGQAGEINLPVIKGMEDFQGSRLCHSSQFGSAQSHNDGNMKKRAVVIGSCNSAHDIAQDYHDHGYDITMVQRSSTCVDPTQYTDGKGLYTEDGPPTEVADLLTQSDPNALMKTKQIECTEELDLRNRNFFEGLKKAGFALDSGSDRAGRKLKYLERGGGYYIDVGASQLIIDGHVKIKQGQEVVQIKAHSLVLADGTELLADEVVFATGYLSMRETARTIFGNDVADKVKEVWGLDEEGELNSVWRRSGHPGFWFAGGNLAMARYYSRMLALQIKGIEEGLMQYRDF